MSTVKFPPRSPKTPEDMSRGWWVEGMDQEAEHPGASWRVSMIDPFAKQRAIRGSYGSGSRLSLSGHVYDTRERRRVSVKNETEELRQRLDNANNHFRWKAAEVLGDEDAVRLLIELYQQSTIRIAEFDACQYGISLARLTAANFCEVGANLIYITEAGQRFIESLDKR